MSKNIIETRDLTKIYKGGIKAVDSLNIEIEEGEVYGLLGPNGAGKTTTIKMLTTNLKPTSGTAVVGGYDIVKNSMDVRKIIGVVPQDLTTDEDLKGIENLMMVARFYDVPDSEARESAQRLLRLVDLQDAAGRYVSQYSGGMRKRLELIVGLIHSPKVLFLDEPTLGLDVQTRSQMWEYITEIQNKFNVTIILTSHYLEEVDALANRISIVDHGKVIVTGTPEELKANMEGDLITIAMKSDEELKSIKEFEDILDSTDLPGNRIRIKVSNSDISLPRLIQHMVKNNISPTSLTVQKPSLHSVFMEYTGRSIRDAEGGEDARKGMMNLRRLRRA